MPEKSASPSGLLFYGALLVTAASVFGYWPELDLWASRTAWEFNGGSFQGQDGWWSWLYYAVRPAMLGASGLALVCGLASLVLGRPVLGFTFWSGVYVLFALALVQGFVVDTYLKDWWGRARPRTIEEFGGQMRFTPFFLVTDQCEKNCSFVSGHAAGGFAFFAFSFLIKGPWRSALFWFALAFGGLAGYMRVLQGAHFLSDVVFSGLVVYGVTWLLFWSMERTVGLTRPLEAGTRP